jgi:phosphoribosylformylglycinamidine synthase
VGARPLAITNCLNFGNPKRPEVYFQFREAVRGMGEACAALGTPVTGGNVSFYNENPHGAVHPTPVVGMIGVVESLAHVTRMAFRQDGDSVVLLGEPGDELGGSEYLAWIHGVTAGAPPRCDLDGERSLIEALLEAIRLGHVRSAHDCSGGGLAVTLAECAIADASRMTGAEIDLSNWSNLPLRALLFGETQGRIVLSTAQPAAILTIAETHGVPAAVIGKVSTKADALRITVGEQILEASLESLGAAYHNTISTIMSAAPSEAAVLEQHPSIATV